MAIAAATTPWQRGGGEKRLVPGDRQKEREPVGAVRHTPGSRANAEGSSFCQTFVTPASMQALAPAPSQSMSVLFISGFDAGARPARASTRYVIRQEALLTVKGTR